MKKPVVFGVINNRSANVLIKKIVVRFLTIKFYDTLLVLCCRVSFS